MEKKHIYHIIEWVVALVACGWLIWKMATYDDYAGLWATLQSMGWLQWLAIGACVALMPVNMALESWRWLTLWNGASSSEYREFGFREAQRQVYYSKLAGLITPWKLGEYPARALLMKSEGENELRNERVWSRVLSIGVVGSATMTAAIIIAGVAAMMIGDWSLVIGDWRFSYLIGVAIILVFLGVGLYFAPRLLRRWATVSHSLVVISLGQSFVRLVCWCVQLGLVIWALDPVVIPLYRYTVIPKLLIYYLLVTITPNVPIAEVGVRGAWAIIVFGTMNAALSGVVLWVINTLLPCIAWFFFTKKTPQNN